MAMVRQYSAANVVGARKLKPLIFKTIKPLLYEKKQSLCVFESLFFGGREVGQRIYAVHLRLIGKPLVD